MISMSRNPAGQEWYETTYNGVGPQEWITLPDTNKCKVSISFPAGQGAGTLEGTCSPASSVANPTNASPIAYPLLAVDPPTTDAQTIIVQGDTAIRFNSSGGPVTISVRC